MKIEEIKELDQMMRDITRLDCQVELCGSMKEKGESESDIDLIVTVLVEHPITRFHDLFETLEKWDSIILEKYNLGLDVVIYNYRKRLICDLRA